MRAKRNKEPDQPRQFLLTIITWLVALYAYSEAIQARSYIVVAVVMRLKDMDTRSTERCCSYVNVQAAVDMYTCMLSAS